MAKTVIFLSAQVKYGNILNQPSSLQDSFLSLALVLPHPCMTYIVGSHMVDNSLVFHNTAYIMRLLILPTYPNGQLKSIFFEKATDLRLKIGSLPLDFGWPLVYDSQDFFQ